MNLDSVYIADCETDGFQDETTKIHTFGIGWKSDNVWQIKDTPDYDNMRKVLANPENVCIFHNGYIFDKVVLEKVLEIEILAEIVDTLPIAWVLFPNRIKEGKKFGLGSFGPDYGFNKPEIESWTNLSYEEYSNRVREDVKINVALWEDCLSYLRELYDNDDARIISFIRFLNQIMDISAEQEKYGIKLNIEKCKRNLQTLQQLAEKKVNILKALIPKIPIKKMQIKPKNCTKQDGSLSAAGKKWYSLLKANNIDENYEGTLEITVGYDEPNPNSVSQMKDYLYSLGWEPEIFVDSVSVKGEVKKVAQIKNKDKELCTSVLKLIEKVPTLEVLADLSTINHRAAYLSGFLKNVKPNGYIQAQIAGLTNTCRFRHKTLVNLIKPSAPYGEYVRSVLVCEDDEILVGSDLSSLENYTRTHFIADLQPDAVDILSDKDYDTHTQLAIYAGMMSVEEEFFYKWYKKENKNKEDLPEIFKVYSDEELSEQFNKLNLVRNKAKTTSYSALYGIGKAKLAKELKIKVSEAEQLLDGYWKLNASVKKFAESCTVKTIRGQDWVLNPLNGFWYTLRKRNDIFSTVNQSAGSFVHILWCKNIRKLGVKIIGNWHDEVLTVCKKENYSEVAGKLQKAIDITNQQARLRVPIKIDIQQGSDYGSVH